MTNTESKEISQARQFIAKCKFDEALQILSDFEEVEGLTLQDKITGHLLQCQLLFWQGKYEDVINLAKQTHEESLGLGKHILSVDPLLLMADALIWQFRHNKAFEIIIQAEELLNTLSQEELRDYIQREASIAYLKGRFYSLKENPEIDRARENLERSLELRKQIDNEFDVAHSLLSLGIIIAKEKLEPDRGLDLIKQALAIGKNIDNKIIIANCLRLLYIFYSIKGELDSSLTYAEQGLTIYKEIDNKPRIAALLSVIGDYYRLKNDNQRALEYMERSLAVNEEIGESDQNPIIIHNLIELHLEMGNLEIAQQYFKRLEQLNNHVESEWVNLIYRVNKVHLLKRSLRFKDLAEAGEMLKIIIKESSQWTNYALLEICDLLLVELGMTNNIEILDEIKIYINQLRNFAEIFKSFWLLAETCFLQAKMSLIKLDMKEARRFLTQAQQIAERHDLKNLVNKISNEQENLLKQLTVWEQLKKSNAPISERIELAKISEHMGQMLRNRAKVTTQITEDDFTIHTERKICLVCRGDIKGYMYACECNAYYCESCAQALTNLENVCWACNAPMDRSKPVKQYIEEEEIKDSIKGEIKGKSPKKEEKPQ